LICVLCRSPLKSAKTRGSRRNLIVEYVDRRWSRKKDEINDDDQLLTQTSRSTISVYCRVESRASTSGDLLFMQTSFPSSLPGPFLAILTMAYFSRHFNSRSPWRPSELRLPFLRALASPRPSHPPRMLPACRQGTRSRRSMYYPCGSAAVELVGYA